MKTVLFVIGTILFFSATALQAVVLHHQLFGVVQEPAPVFSSPDSPRILSTTGKIDALADQCGQVRTLEFIALPGTACIVHEILESDGVTVYRITTDDYPVLPSKKLFLDARSVKRLDVESPRRNAVLPQQLDILRRLESAVGLPYVWGGNVREGVPAVRGKVFQGLDCSGLLYEATKGFTPRNTSELVLFGKPVKIAGLTPVKVAERLKPLDLIVWNGHVIILLDGQRAIESRLECRKPGYGGVVIRPLKVVLTELFKSRLPVDEWPKDHVVGRKSFVVRRWFEGDGK